MRKHRPFFYLLVAVSSILGLPSFPASAQSPTDKLELTASNVKSKNTNTSGPVFKEYRKIAIGMTQDAVDDVLGKPDKKYPDQLFYELSDTELVQIVVGPEKKVTAISVSFAEGEGAPGLDKIFGEGIGLEKRPDGSFYKLVRYPDAGYWISYHAGTGEKATVTLMMQKL